MKRFTCNLIAAVGKRGQLGLNGHLPWQDKEDLSYFKSMTGTDVILVGRRTFEVLPALPARIVVGITTGKLLVRGDPRLSEIGTAGRIDPTVILGECFMHWPDRVWWVAGGETVFKDFIEAGVVRRSYITHISYDGPADTYFPWGSYGNCNQEKEPVAIVTASGPLRKSPLPGARKKRAK